MNEHAKKIWNAWVNGSHKTQYYSEVHSTWLDAYPNFMSEENQPQSKPDSWRIPTASGVRTSKPERKPENVQENKKTKKIRYRVALIDCDGEELKLHIVYPYHGIHVDFIRWVGPEQEVELCEGEWEEEE